MSKQNIVVAVAGVRRVSWGMIECLGCFCLSVWRQQLRGRGGGGKGREETVGRRGGAAGEEKVQEVEVRRGKGRERARERTACLNHPTAGTVCAACVQFEHLIETDILHVPPSLCGLPAELWWKLKGAVWRLPLPFDRREIRYNGHVIWTKTPPPTTTTPTLHASSYTRCGVSDPNLQSAKRKPKRGDEGVGGGWRMEEAVMLEN